MSDFATALRAPGPRPLAAPQSAPRVARACSLVGRHWRFDRRLCVIRRPARPVFRNTGHDWSYYARCTHDPRARRPCRRPPPGPSADCFSPPLRPGAARLSGFHISWPRPPLEPSHDQPDAPPCRRSPHPSRRSPTALARRVHLLSLVRESLLGRIFVPNFYKTCTAGLQPTVTPRRSASQRFSHFVATTAPGAVP
jgi:hypothetical protein